MPVSEVKEKTFKRFFLCFLYTGAQRWVTHAHAVYEDRKNYLQRNEFVFAPLSWVTHANAVYEDRKNYLQRKEFVFALLSWVTRADACS